MKIENGIRWCDATTNAVTGCSKVSPGCKNCYAEICPPGRVLRSKGIETWGSNGVRQPVNFEPVFRRLNKLCVCHCCHEALPARALNSAWRHSVGCPGISRRIRLFADSNSDWLDERWPVETLARFLDAIRLAPNVDVILLTKRPESFNERLAAAERSCERMSPLERWIRRWAYEGEPPANVWLGVSVEDQQRADGRIPILRDTPAYLRLLSVEPLLEYVDIVRQTNPNCYDWVIVGGESGLRRRDCGVAAIVNVVEQCRAAGVPCFCKQDCAPRPGRQGRIPDEIWRVKEFPKP